jgi:hypothetical protein
MRCGGWSTCWRGWGAGPASTLSIARLVVLVEGVSDQRAVEALAVRHGRDLTADGVAVVPTGGATNVERFLARLVEASADVRVAGLVDQAQAWVVQRALTRVGFGADLAAAGFFVCVADLEDELIRALGREAVEHVLATEGDLRSYRVFERQPAQRDRPDRARLRRFLGTRSRRKIRYGAALVEALDLDRMPAPLARLQARL